MGISNISLHQKKLIVNDYKHIINNPVSNVEILSLITLGNVPILGPLLSAIFLDKNLERRTEQLFLVFERIILENSILKEKNKILEEKVFTLLNLTNQKNNHFKMEQEQKIKSAKEFKISKIQKQSLEEENLSLREEIVFLTQEIKSLLNIIKKDTVLIKEGEKTLINQTTELSLLKLELSNLRRSRKESFIFKIKSLSGFNLMQNKLGGKITSVFYIFFFSFIIYRLVNFFWHFLHENYTKNMKILKELNENLEKKLREKNV